MSEPVIEPGAPDLLQKHRRPPVLCPLCGKDHAAELARLESEEASKRAKLTTNYDDEYRLWRERLSAQMAR